MSMLPNDQIDERRGRPSASNMHRLALCPGSWNAERGLSDIESTDAASGTMLHAVLGDEIAGDGLDHDDAWVVNQCRELESRLVAQLGFDGPDIEICAEQRLWHQGNDGRSWSGKADRLYINASAGQALCIDYKTGRGEVPASESNWQLRSLAVLAAANRDTVKGVFVAIIQPRATESVTLAYYDENDLGEADNDIAAVLYLASLHDATRRPGEAQCQYCRAKDRCPEAIASAIAMVNIELPALTGEQYAEWLPQAKMASKVIEALMQSAKRFIEGGGVIPGWGLKPGSTNRMIADPQAAFAALSDIATPEEFARICSVPVGALEKLYAEKSGLKGKALSEMLALRLGNAITTKQNAASLAKVGA